MQDWKVAGLEGFRTGVRQDWKDAGLEGCRKEGFMKGAMYSR